MAVQYYRVCLLACRILPRERSPTFLIHPKCQLSFKKQHLPHNSDWFQNRWILCKHVTCWVTGLHFNASRPEYRDVTDIHFHMLFHLPLSLSTFYVSFIFIYYIIYCLLLPVCFPLYLSSFFLLCFIYSLCLHIYIYVYILLLHTFLSLFFVVSCVLLIFFFQSLFSSYLLPCICLYFSNFHFVLSVFWHSVSTFLY